MTGGGLSAHHAGGGHAGGERRLEDQHPVDGSFPIGIGDVQAAGRIEGDGRGGGQLVQGQQPGRGGRQVGLPGNKVELADFQVRADGCRKAALGDIAGRVAQNPIVSGIGQPEIVLGIERDRRR